jgi:mannose-1-phosphate guanylyltransferase
VLVGGEGTRLRPLTLTTPKQMLPVAGRPMIERVIDHLAVHGIDDVVLSLGYRPDAFVATYPDGVYHGVHLHYAIEAEPLGTGGAIAFAARHAGIDDTFLVVNGDVLTSSDIGALIEAHHRWGAEASISLTPVEDPSSFGVVPTDEEGRVTAFIEKPPPEETPTNLINAGFYVMEPSVLDQIPDGRPVSIEREIFPRLVTSGRLYALASHAPWIDVGTPQRYLEANLAFAGPHGVIGPGGSVHPTATVSRSVIGAGVVIGADTTVCEAVLLDGVRVEDGASVCTSMVGKGAVIGAGARLEDYVVVGDGVTVAPATSWASARVTHDDE